MELTEDAADAILVMADKLRAMGLPMPRHAAELVAALKAEKASTSTGTGTTPTLTDYVSTGQAARKLGCSRRYATRLAPHLGGVKVGNRWLIPTSAL